MLLIFRRFAMLAISLPLCGCLAPLVIESPGDRASRMLGVGEPIVELAQAEPLHVAESSPDTLTMRDALRLALRHDAQLQAALADVRIAQADAKQTRLLTNPIIAVAFRLPSGGGKSVIDADIAADLLTLLTRPGRVGASDARLRVSAAESLTTVLDIAAQVQRQYVETQSIDARLALAQQRREALTQLVTIARNRLELGEASRLDLLTAQGELASASTQLLSLESERRLARITLSRLTGQPRSIATWRLMPWSSPTIEQIDEDERIEIALRHRPELEAIKWELAALGQEAKLARAAALLGGSVGVSAERDDIWSVGPALSLPLPIFDTGRVARARVQSQITRQSHLLTHESREVIEEVRRSIESHRAAIAALQQIDRDVVPLQQQRLDAAKVSYESGQSDIIALRLAEQALQDSRSQRIDLEQQVALTAIALERASGRSVTPATQPTTEVRP